MPRIANAFKFRAADRTILDTKLFLSLYSPILLDELNPDDLHLPKLLILRGSPGSGKSSLLRLFETETLLALNERRGRPNDQPLIDQLANLGALDDEGIKVVGIYIDCDSSLRDIANLDVDGANAKLLNTILDMQVINGFVRSFNLLVESGMLPRQILDIDLVPLPASEAPPAIFAKPQTLQSIFSECLQAQADFARLLNSFPGEPIPSSIQPHAHIFSIIYLSYQITNRDHLKNFIPLVMLDDLHELYEDQRNQIKDDFLRRSPIPRWVALRKHVYELEDLISVEGHTDQRDYRELDLDRTRPQTFRRFVSKVAELRLRQSASLQQYNVDDFKAQLKEPDETVNALNVSKAIEGLKDRLERLEDYFDHPPKLDIQAQVPVENLVEFEGRLILAERMAERKAREPQMDMFPALEPLGPLNAKTREAAVLFAAKRFEIPYYHSFDTLADVANRNVEQFLAVAAVFADKMIFRAELGKETLLTTREQEELIKAGAETYYSEIEQRYKYGYFIRQIIDNLGLFFHAVTYRSNAPIAPGVNGFGIPRQRLRYVLREHGRDNDIMFLIRVLTSAVAGNVFFVRVTKQGQQGEEKIVFYLNRLLCVKYNLPLNTGGWQPLTIEKLMRMMKGPIPAKDWGKKWVGQLGFDDIEEEE